MRFVASGTALAFARVAAVSFDPGTFDAPVASSFFERDRGEAL
jgi:hypothetical protein